MKNITSCCHPSPIWAEKFGTFWAGKRYFFGITAHATLIRQVYLFLNSRMKIEGKEKDCFPVLAPGRGLCMSCRLLSERGGWGESGADTLLAVPFWFPLKEHRQPPQQLTPAAHLVSVFRWLLSRWRGCPDGAGGGGVSLRGGSVVNLLFALIQTEGGLQSSRWCM